MQLYSLSKRKGIAPPAVFFNGRIYDYRDTKKCLLSDIKNCVSRTSSSNQYQAMASIKDLFHSFTPAVVFFSGLIDGVNPCAFLTLCFFLSYLSSGSSRKLKITGGAFITGVFVTYLFLGMAGHECIGVLEKSGVDSFLNYGLLGLTALFFVFSLFDLIQVLEGKNGMINALPVSWIQKIHRLIRFIPNDSKSLLCISVAFSVGIIVSLVETVCTGQIYLPVIKIIFETGNGSLRMKSFFLLVVYNIAFIIPLVFLLLGYSSIRERNMAVHYRKFHSWIRFGISSVLALLFFIQIRFL